MILGRSEARAAAQRHGWPGPRPTPRCERIPTVTRHCQSLQVGQTIRVESLDVSYRLTVLAGGDGSKLVEKGDDYLVFEDPSGEVRTRIPMHLIQTVVTPDQPAAVAA